MEIIDNDVIQYVIPECSEVVLMIPQNTDVSISMLDGAAKLGRHGQLISLQSGQELSLWPSMKLPLYSSSGCAFRIRGNHEIHKAFTVTTEDISKDLFKVLKQGSAFDFLLEKGIQLHISVGHLSDVSLTLIHGAPEILGCTLDFNKEYNLPPYSSVIVDYFTTKSCSLRIKGTKRRIKVLAMKEMTWELMRNVHSRIHVQRRRAIKNTSCGPNVLVMGPPNVGKTSFCYFLLNKAIGNNMKPVYIDLDVCGNSNTAAGTVSLIKVEGQREINEGFLGNKKSFLFGYVNPESHLIYYHLLVKRLSELYRANYMADGVNHAPGIVVEMCGSLAERLDANAVKNIYYIMQAFEINMVVVVGSRRYYDAIEQVSFIKDPNLQFILQPQYIEQKNFASEIRVRENAFLKYFHGTIHYPLEPNILKVNFYDIRIYRVIHNAHANNENYDVKNIKIDDVRAVPVTCDENILNQVLGVSEAVIANESLPVTALKYFVHVQSVYMERRIVSVWSPNNNPLAGAILMMGDPAVYRL